MEEKIVLKFSLVVITFFAVQPLVYAEASDQDKLRALFQHFFKPIKTLDVTDKPLRAKIQLGKTLFYDARLSKTGEYSCNSCHDLKKYGTNGDYFLQQKSNEDALRDVPSIYNKAGLNVLGWTGRHKTLNAYLKYALVNPYEMANDNVQKVVAKINGTKGYKPLIKNAVGSQQLTEQQFIQALVHFINGLLTPAPMDKFMLGDNAALTPVQISGGLMFDKKYCHSCHTGTNLGGRMIQQMGIKEPWPNQRDLGLYLDTQQSSHKMFFRVSTLRNIEKTAPYFHDGSSKRMWDAVKKMARYELGHSMELNDALAIQAFFTGLTGKIPTNYIKKPSIPN
jgi:cytochrome c peroxidase